MGVKKNKTQEPKESNNANVDDSTATTPRRIKFNRDGVYCTDVECPKPPKNVQLPKRLLPLYCD